ncbi:MAG: peptidase MA family metallohydrolase [Anaerolineales bacterium]
MSPSTTCPPTHANRRQLGWLLSLLLALALVWPVPVVRADTHGQLQSNEVSYTFAEAIYFDLEAQATTPPTDVILFYGIDGEPVWRRIYPDGDLGTKIDIAYTEELLPGQFAPGETLRYYWRLEFADGTRLETPVERFVYEDDRFEWRVLSSTTIDLHYYGNAKNQAADLLVVAQEAQERLSTEVGVATDTRLQVYLYNSARDMSAALAQRSTIFDSQVTTLGVAVSDDTLLLLGSDENAPATLAHELSHLIVGLATDNPYAGLPRWLDEGLAMYAEGQLPRNNRLALEQAIKEDSLLTIRSMSSYSGQAEQVDMYYGAVYSVVDYMLQTYGRDKMRALLRVFAQGARQEDALQQVYGLTLDELDAGWRQSLGLKPRSAPTSAPLFWLLQKAAA